MSAADTLTAELRAEVKILEEDLRQRLAVSPDVKADWTRQHTDASTVGRTAISWEEWSSERITQAAVAWVLTTVFIRFAEDNGLVKPVWISGPPARRAEALNAQSEFMRTRAQAGENPTDRDWLVNAIDYLSGLPTAKALFDETSAMWLITPSGDAAGRLLAFWRERDESGELRRDLRDEKLDTRFLGDLYQDLSLEAQDKYALKQTPVFVEEFILDRTLEPALKERPLEGFKVIDPTCGSGHFLLGAFERLLERWEEHAAGLNSRARVQKTLDAIHGVDLNPFAVAIARFRLTIAALQAAGESALDAGNPIVFNLNLAAGDSLLHGLDQQEIDYGPEHHTDRTVGNHAYPTENLAALRRILNNGQYDAVVGNPPYITVKDKALNAAYRDRYRYLKRTYALTVPFMERFFGLAKSGERAGWVGQITSNSFMKRDFGAPLVEKYLPGRDIRLIINSEGAWMRGHNMDGTPTAIIVGTNRTPATDSIRVVMSKGRREGRDVGSEGKGPYWSAIARHLDDDTFEDDWVLISALPRRDFSGHPWSLEAGSSSIQRVLEAAGRKLSDVVQSVGYTGQTNSDSAFLATADAFRRKDIPRSLWRPFITGDEVRNFGTDPQTSSLFPYVSGDLIDIVDHDQVRKWMWPNRTSLWARATFAGPTYKEEGRPWWGWHQVAKHRLSGPAITWAFIEAANHFVYLDECLLHNRHAPILKLPTGASEADYLGNFALLNSSACCYWMRSACQPKGGAADSIWARTFEFAGNILEQLPIPKSLPLGRGSVLHGLAQELASCSPRAVLARHAAGRESLKAASGLYHSIIAKMIAQQEELDWEVYRLYGLVDEDLTHSGDDLPELVLGERAFEIVLARRMRDDEEKTAWFVRHGSTPVTEIPEHWPVAYRDLVQRRIDLIASHPYLKLLERPENKRRWAAEPWEKQEERALRGWLLDRLEDRGFWFDRSGTPITRSVAQLADEVARDQDMASVLTLWEGRPDVSVAASLEKLLVREAVPFLAAYRYKESGLRKRLAWEHTWVLQRREDAGEKFGKDNPILVPPKYTSADFARKEYWDNRGKLDVPKERFILYPDTARETDPSPVLGWAGWDHAQQAYAIDQLMIQGERDGWPDERLIPLVAGLSELLPWVEQWHHEAEDFYGGESAANTVRQQLTERMQQVERTREQLAAWRPQRARRGRRAAK
jgi:uncharacterized protein DUF7008/Eco57I restriction-modification methylase